jgi:hypothetical protein
MSEPHQTSMGSRKRERPAGHLDLPCRASRGTSEQVAAERLAGRSRWSSDRTAARRERVVPYAAGRSVRPWLGTVLEEDRAHRGSCAPNFDTLPDQVPPTHR